MDSITASRPFTSDLDAMVAHCRSIDSRRSWPGAVPSWDTPDTLYYQVSMRLKAATITDIDLEEKVGPVLTEDGSVLFHTTQRCTWPDGTADASTTYRFVAGSPNVLELTYSYEPPSTKLVKTKALPGFHDGMEKVVARYLDGLTGATVLH